MNLSRRVVLSLLVAAIVLFLGMLFWPFIVNNIVRPAALVVWLLLRILVLSIHQKYFWYAVIFAAFIVLFRLFPREQSEIQSNVRPENGTMITIGYWRGLLTYSGHNVREDTTLQRELTHLLTSLYASKQSTANNWGLQDALQGGRIPLPRNIHTILFSQEPPRSGGPLKTFFQSLRETPRRWIRQWTGQEKTAYYQMIDEVLKFMETSLELNHDDRKLSQNKR